MLEQTAWATSPHGRIGASSGSTPPSWWVSWLRRPSRSGLTELYFTSQDIKRAVTRVERDKASSAALSIQQLKTGFLRQLDSVAQPTVGTGPAGLEERTQDFQRVLEREPLISRLTYLDGDGKERLSVSPLQPVVRNSGIDFSRRPAFVRARRTSRTSVQSTSCASRSLT